MIWSIWANQFQELPELIKAKMWVYLTKHGADPARMRGFTFDSGSGAIWVEYVEVNSLNLAEMDIEGTSGTGAAFGPTVRSEWLWLEDPKGKDRPDFLEWMTVGTDPPASLGAPGNPKYPRVHLKPGEWGTGRDGL